MVRDNAGNDQLLASLAVHLGFAELADIKRLADTELENESTLRDALVAGGVLTTGQAKLLDSLASEIVEKHGDVDDSLAFLTGWNSSQTAAMPAPDTNRSSPDDVTDQTADFSFPAETPPATPLDSFTPSDQRYEIKKFLAQGGIGQVSVAVDREFNREVAFKEIRADRTPDTNQLNRFWIEAQITGKLEHPGVVPVYSLGKRDNEDPYYAMRFIRGKSMTESIREFHANRATADDAGRQIQFRKLLQCFVSVCNTVHFAHSQRVIHRDIKPDNIMLGSYGETLVVDWGIAKTIKTSAEQETNYSDEDSDVESLTTQAIGELVDKAATQQGAIMGTFGFMSPEQLLGWQDRIDPRSDVYSLGGLLYAILAGRNPNADEHWETIWRNTLSGDTKPPREFNPDAPKSLEAVTLKAMARKPGERYQTAAELAADVEAFLADESVSAYPDPPLVRFRRWLRRHPAIASATAVSTGLVVLGLTIGLLVVGSFNKRLEQANGELKLANERETTQRKRAETNFQIAESAVETYLDTTTLNPELATSRFSGLRKTLLETAIPFYQEFLAQRPDESEFDLSQGKARFRLGQIFLQTGEHEKGLEQFQLASTVFQRLREAEPEDSNWIRWVCRCQNETVACLYRQDRHREAVDVARASIKSLNGLLESQPNNVEALSDLVKVTSNLGVCQFSLDAYDEAEASVARHAELLEKLKQAKGTTPSQANYQLAANYNNLGAMKNQQQQWRAAFAPLHKSIQLGNDLIRKHPNVDEYRHTLSQAYHNIARSMRGTKDYKDAVANFKVAEQQNLWLASTNPNIAKFQQSLAMTYNSMGLTYLEWGKRAEAIPSLKKGVEAFQKMADRYPNVPEYRFRLSLSHNNLGLEETGLAIAERQTHLEKAVQLQEELVQASPDNREFRFHLSTSQSNLGLVFQDKREFETAIQWFSSAEQNSAKLPAISSEARSSGANATWGLGECYVELKRHNEAAEAWRRTAERMTDPTRRHIFEVRSAKSSALAGDVQAADREIDKLLAFEKKTAETHLRVAEILAICTAQSKNDEEAAKAFLERTREQLQRVKQLDGFREPRIAKQLSDGEWFTTVLDDSEIEELLKP